VIPDDFKTDIPPIQPPPHQFLTILLILLSFKKFLPHTPPFFERHYCINMTLGITGIIKVNMVLPLPQPTRAQATVDTPFKFDL